MNKRRFYKSLQLFIVLSLFSGTQAMAQWSGNPSVNNAICTYGADQDYPKIISDGSGGAIITWRDLRSPSTTSYDVYVQRISATGYVQWTTDGVVVTAANGFQMAMTLTSDGNGGAIITWHDKRNGDFDIYAQRINSAGVIQWQTNGVAICTLQNDQTNPAIVADGSGGAIISWEDNRTGTDLDIYAQKINASGVVQWSANGVPVCLATSTQDISKIISDGNGGAILTWDDRRNNPEYDIYVQRINASGVAQWTTNGEPICTLSGDQWYTEIIPGNNGGAIISWRDKRNAVDFDIYAQYVNAAGVAQWTANGVAICTATDDQEFPLIVSDGNGGGVISWVDRRGAETDVYAQKINSAGTVQWQTDGVGICMATNYQSYPTITTDNNGGAIITWQDPRGAVEALYAQRINSAGVPQWLTDGVLIANSSSVFKRLPMIASDGSGGAIITWYEQRSTSFADIYAQHISGDGDLGVGIEEHSLAAVSFFPNPTDGKINIQSPEKILQAEVRNMLGEIVYTTSVNAMQQTIDLSFLPDGAYFISLTTTLPSGGPAIYKEKIILAK